eukprot:PITA_15423
MNPTISCNAFEGITTPQTLKIGGYINRKKVIVLIDLGSTHNFIHCKIAKELNCFLYPAPEFQVMVANGGTINCSGKCHNIKLNMGEYVWNSPMLSIPMDGVDVVLGVQWLQYLGMIIIFNGITKLLKKEKQGIVSQLCSLEVQTSKSSISPDLQKFLENHSKVFETPKVLPPIHDHDHVIHLIPRIFPPNIKPYRYPYAQKSEIECMVVEMLVVGIIQPSQSSFSTPAILVHNKDGSWHMCLDYMELKNLTIKDKFPIPFIDELLDEL